MDPKWEHHILVGGVQVHYTIQVDCDDQHYHRTSYIYNRTFLALVQMESMCADHERSDEKRTPKYLKVSTCSSGMPFKRNCVGYIAVSFT